MSTSPSTTRTSIPGERIIAIDKRTALGILAVFVILFAAFALSQYKTYPSTPHTCHFDRGSLDILCSKELRIFEGTEKVQVGDRVRIEDSGPAVRYKVSYYEQDVYSDGPSSNIMSIWKVKNPETPSEIPSYDPLFSEPRLFYLRLIEVTDINTGENFTFYVKETGDYNVEANNTFDYYIDACNQHDGGCLSDWGNWRCWHYDYGARMCSSLAASISSGKQPIERCYELEREDMVAYCLGQANSTLCSEYAASRPDLGWICGIPGCGDASNSTGD